MLRNLLQIDREGPMSLPFTDTVRRITDSFARQTMMATFGAVLRDISAGRVVLAAPILPGMHQQQGYGHAALTFGLGDSAAGYAALSLMPDGQEVVTVEMKINLVAPATGNLLIATGEVVKAGRRLIVVRAEVECETGGTRRAVAVLQGTMMPVDL
jgi:uncharacterized protein (TIGR00369 family)